MKQQDRQLVAKLKTPCSKLEKEVWDCYEKLLPKTFLTVLSNGEVHIKVNKVDKCTDHCGLRILLLRRFTYTARSG